MVGEYEFDFHMLHPRVKVCKKCGNRVKLVPGIGYYSCEECNSWLHPNNAEWRAVSMSA